MKNEQIHAVIDDRARLVATLLAVTSWPEDEQARKAHGTHAHARATRRLLLPHGTHPAALAVQALLDQGVPLEAIFEAALSLDWPGLSGATLPAWMPPDLSRQMLDFYEQAGLSGWWEEEAGVWQHALEEAAGPLGVADLRRVMQPFVGAFADALVFMPNICYPSDSPVGAAVDSVLYCIAPPRVAWGDNPPWPFDEDPAYLYCTALMTYARLLMRRHLAGRPDVLAAARSQPLPVSAAFARQYPTWDAQFLALFGRGLVAIYLEDFVSPREAEAYILVERKAHGLTLLPGVVSALRHYLAGWEQGSTTGFVNYVPQFAAYLAAAKSSAPVWRR